MDHCRLSSSLKRMCIDRRSQNKVERIKIDPNEESSFLDALKEIMRRTSFDCEYRSSLISHLVPECCFRDASCHNHPETTESYLAFETEPIRINIQSNLTTEALAVFKVQLLAGKYPPHDILQDIIGIILNAHELKSKGYSIPNLLQNCKMIFSLLLSSHPPCSSSLKQIFIKFLITPYNWNNPFNCVGWRQTESELFNYLSCEFQKELAANVPDEPFMNLSGEVENEEVTFERAHFLQNKFETHSYLHREDRIERLFVTLNVIVNLLEKDFAIWISKNAAKTDEILTGKSKPIIALLIWDWESSEIGSMSPICRSYFQIFVNSIILDFPLEKVKILGRLFDLICHAFYCCDKNPNYSSSIVGPIAVNFAEQLFTILRVHDLKVLLTVINLLNATYMQHLLSSMALKTVTNIEKDFVDVVTTVFKEKKRVLLSNSEFKYPPRKKIKLNSAYGSDFPFFKFSNKIETCKLYKNFQHLNGNTHNVIDLQNQNIDRIKFQMLFYYSLKYFFEFNNIEDILILLRKKIGRPYLEFYQEFEEKSIKIENKKFIINKVKKLDLTKSLDSYQGVKLNSESIQYFKKIFEDALSIVKIYRNMQSKYSNLHSLLDNINFLRLY